MNPPAVAGVTPERDVEPASEVPPTEAGSAASTDSSPAIVLDTVSKVYGHAGNAVHALDRVSLDVAEGEFVCLLGASGCGKSTLLNILADLDRATTGTVEVEGSTTLMFQDAALFPWLTARGNIDLALKLRNVSKEERKARIDELLELVHLSEFAKKRPHELSGGMRQRVALARALSQDSDVLLMDEPFGALDAMTRDLLHDELEELISTTQTTVVFVTHNVREAVRLGDRVVLLSSRPGRVAAEFPISTPRPRRMDSSVVAEQAAAITDRLREEVRRHGDA
jgi:NitT/TauT family transport system ATP-binding protein